jgi:hypothetical protein
MKKLFFTLLMAVVTLAANALVGVYPTYEDLKNGTPVVFDGDKYTVKGKFLEKTIAGKVKGEEKSFLMKDIYGVHMNGDLLRIYNYGGAVAMVKLVGSGEYHMYQSSYVLEDAMGSYDRTTTIWFVSKGLDGKIFRMNSKGEFDEMVANNPEYKDLPAECAKYKGPLITKIGWVIAKSPNFKNGKDMIPPVKQ